MVLIESPTTFNNRTNPQTAFTIKTLTPLNHFNDHLYSDPQGACLFTCSSVWVLCRFSGFLPQSNLMSAGERRNV